MALALLLCAGCSYESYELGAPEDVGDSSDTWTVLVYMCGSDLESEAGLATDNLIELTGSELGNNVNFVIQTGGASKWRNNIITAKKAKAQLGIVSRKQGPMWFWSLPNAGEGI